MIPRPGGFGKKNSLTCDVTGEYNEIGKDAIKVKRSIGIILLCLILLFMTACNTTAPERMSATTKASAVRPKPIQVTTQTPTTEPTVITTVATKSPTTIYTEAPTTMATTAPTQKPTTVTVKPTTAPTKTPTTAPTKAPTTRPTTAPTAAPTQAPTTKPATVPTQAPTTAPTTAPTQMPTTAPTVAPTIEPTTQPTFSGVYYTYSDGYGNSYTVPEGVDIFDYTLAQANLPEVTSLFPELEKLIYQKTNEEREKLGLSALEWEEDAYFFANTRAYEASVLWDHTRPNGESYDQIFAEYKVLCNNGENLYSYYSSTLNEKYIASIVGTYVLAESAITGWMNSPGHRANILEQMWESMVVGVYYDADAQKLLAVQLFFA